MSQITDCSNYVFFAWLFWCFRPRATRTLIALWCLCLVSCGSHVFAIFTSYARLRSNSLCGQPTASIRGSTAHWLLKKCIDLCELRGFTGSHKFVFLMFDCEIAKNTQILESVAKMMHILFLVCWPNSACKQCDNNKYLHNLFNNLTERLALTCIDTFGPLVKITPAEPF